MSTITIFIVNLVLIFIWKILIELLPIKNRKRTFCVIVAIQLSLFLGLRSLDTGNSNVRSDVILYFTHYTNLKNIPLFDSFVYNQGKSILYYFICAIFAKFGIPYQVFIFIVSVFSISILSRHIYKYSGKPLLSFITFLGIGGFIYSFYLIRQAMAVAFALLCFDYLYRDKKIRTIVIFIIAVLIHSSAIVLLPLLFLRNIKLTKNILAIFAFTLAFAILFRIEFATIVTYIFDEGYIGYYLSNISLGGSALLCIFVMFLYVYDHGRTLFFTENITLRLIMYGLMMASFIQICSSFSYAFTRLNFYYYQMIFLIAIPGCVESQKYKFKINDHKIPVFYFMYIVFLVILITLYFVGITNEKLFNYMFFWE